MADKPVGLCGCGCGGAAPVAKYNLPSAGWVKGQPKRFIRGHHMRGRKGESAPRWKGGRKRNREGYWLLFMPGHRLANSTGYVLEHRLAWEQANGRELLPGEHVHHVDGDRGNNAPGNLVAVDAREHYRLHARSDDTSRRRREAQLRRFRDPREREKNADAQRRRYASPEEREKTAAAVRASWRARRGH